MYGTPAMKRTLEIPKFVHPFVSRPETDCSSTIVAFHYLNVRGAVRGAATGRRKHTLTVTVIRML